MSTGITTKLMTAEEFCDWVHQPENSNKWWELVRGEVVELPSPTKPQGFICSNIAGLLGNYTFQAMKGYIASNDGGVILERDPDTVRGPDIAYFEDAVGFDDLHPKYGEVPPRLVVEVLSPNDRATVVLIKIEDYIRAGVELVWYVNPERRTVTVYRPKMAPKVFTADQELSGENVLPGFTCRVADTFRLPGDKRREKEAGS